jgi:hypothetical protein
MYDIQTSTCNGDIAKIAEDTISSFNKIECNNGKVIIPLQEKITITVCDTGGNPYGIEVDTSGVINDITTKTNELEKNKLNLLYIGGGISSSAKTNSPNKFLIGEAPSSASTSTIYLKTYLDCSDYITPKELTTSDKEVVKDKILECIKLKYRNNVQWKLITFQKDQTESQIVYTYISDLGDKFKSFNLIRQINTNIEIDNSCVKKEETKEEKSQAQELKIVINCNNKEDEINKLKEVYIYPDNIDLENIVNSCCTSKEKATLLLEIIKDNPKDKITSLKCES